MLYYIYIIINYYFIYAGRLTFLLISYIVLDFQQPGNKNLININKTNSKISKFSKYSKYYEDFNMYRK